MTNSNLFLLFVVIAGHIAAMFAMVEIYEAQVDARIEARER
jgi:hypothetical protein